LSATGKPAQTTPQGRCELVRSSGTLGQKRVFVQLLDRGSIGPLHDLPELAVQPPDLVNQDQDRSAGCTNFRTRIARQALAPAQKRLERFFVKSCQRSASVL
jgi:hypothetical protein